LPISHQQKLKQLTDLSYTFEYSY